MKLVDTLKYNPRFNPIISIIFFLTLGISIFNHRDLSFWINCYIIYFISFALGVGMALHRIAAHDSTKLPKSILYFFSFIGSLAHVGTPKEWFLGHNIHHQFADTIKDPILPTLKGFNHILGIYQPISASVITRWLFNARNSSVMNDKFLLSLSNYFYLYLISTYLIVYLIFDLTGLQTFIIGNIGALIATSLLTHWSHVKQLGYRNFQESNQSSNLILLFPLFFGEELHNNHHARPKLFSNSIHWWEFDIIGAIMKWLSLGS
ncbi:MAG: fatty acid desaturase [Bdellovibrionales bacterium]|nr:fatty acid desaturase [Bdellovibrionales bacterium]